MDLFSRPIKLSQPSPTRAASDDVASSPLPGNSDELPQRQRNTGWTSFLLRLGRRRKGASIASRDNLSPPMERVNPIIPKVGSSAPNAATGEIPTPMPSLTGPGRIFTNFTMVPPTEMISTIDPEPDLLAEAWDRVKDGPKDSDDSANRAIDVFGANENFADRAGF